VSFYLKLIASLAELPCFISSAEAIAYNELSGIKSLSDRLKGPPNYFNNGWCVSLCDWAFN
jgi:hypothetical protein